MNTLKDLNGKLCSKKKTDTHGACVFCCQQSTNKHTHTYTHTFHPSHDVCSRQDITTGCREPNEIMNFILGVIVSVFYHANYSTTEKTFKHTYTYTSP